MSLSDPGGRLISVAPSDTTDLPGICSQLYVSVAGTLTITDEARNTLQIPIAIAGWHPIRVRRVWSTGTAATGMIALYQI